MEWVKALMIVLGIALFVGGLIGIWLSIGFFGSDFLMGLIFLGVSIAFTIMGIAWTWYTLKHFV
jgi:hypothetical protein